MKSHYRKTVAGFVWVVLNPILSFMIQSLIFKHILRIQITNYYLFLISGIIPWVFITNSLNVAVLSFVSNRSTLMAFKLPLWIFPLSHVIDSFTNFIVSYVILIIFVGELQIFSFYQIPLFFLSSLILIAFVFVASFLLATLNVFMRDTQFILQFVLHLAYFVTPIFYPISLLPPNLQLIAKLNPLYIFIRPFYHLIYHFDPAQFWNSTLISLVTLILFSSLCLVYWRKKRNELRFYL